MAILNHTPPDRLSKESTDFLRGYVERESGISLGTDKDYLLYNRLLPILAHAKLNSFEELCGRLRLGKDASLRRAVVEAITTHETLFFRDFAIFNCVRSWLLPELAALKKSSRSLRIWSAACSSGQEAYSLAMMLLESPFRDWNIQIVATDLSSQILQKAISGRYSQLEVGRGLPAPLLVKYFDQAGRDWRVKDSLRPLVTFSNLDLRQASPSLGTFDLVFCRNVLIYFDPLTTKQVLSGIRSVVSPGGFLVVGLSESNSIVDDVFLRRNFDGEVIYQKSLVA